jgi:hypothetical protein
VDQNYFHQLWKEEKKDVSMKKKAYRATEVKKIKIDGFAAEHVEKRLVFRTDAAKTKF